MSVHNLSLLMDDVFAYFFKFRSLIPTGVRFTRLRLGEACCHTALDSTPTCANTPPNEKACASSLGYSLRRKSMSNRVSASDHRRYSEMTVSA